MTVRSLGEMPWRGDLATPMGQRGAVGASLVYLLDDEFTTDDAAPVTTPRTCEPGPGVLKIGQPANEISIASGIIQASAGNTSGTVFVVGNVTFAHGAGRCLKLVAAKNAGSSSSFVGWANSNVTLTSAWRGTLEEGFYRDIATGAFIAPPAGTTLSSTAADYCFVRNADGGVWVFKDSLLVWVDDGNGTAALYPLVFHSSVVASTPQASAIRMTDLPGVWTLSRGIVVFTDTTLLSNDTFTGVADGLHEFEFTLPGSPAANDEIVLQYRRLDSSNYWKATIKRNAGNTAWDFLLDSVSGGTPTNRITVTGVGTPDKLRAIANGSLHDCYTRAAGAWTKRGSQINISHQNTQVGMGITAVAGTTLTRVSSWARSSSAYDVLGSI
jgi:hypothetical protein